MLENIAKTFIYVYVIHMYVLFICMLHVTRYMLHVIYVYVNTYVLKKVDPPSSPSLKKADFRFFFHDKQFFFWPSFSFPAGGKRPSVQLLDHAIAFLLSVELLHF